MGKQRCALCGKERFDPDVHNEFYLCGDCSFVWLADYLRRVKARIIDCLRRLTN
jgi:hypothetical protein